MLPHTLSHPYDQFLKHRDAAQWSKAANYLLDFFEAGVQYVSVVLLGLLRDEVLKSGYVPGDNVTKVVAKIDGKRPLSMGDWCNDILPPLVREIAAVLPEHPLSRTLPEVVGKKRNIFLGSKAEKSIVQVRNEYKGHSTTLSESIYAEVVDMLLPRAEKWIAALQPLQDYVPENLEPLVRHDSQGHEYVFQSLKEESVSYISVDEDALTYIGEDFNEAFDAWMQTLVPSFDISKDLNWEEYVCLTHGVSARYLERIYAQKKYNRELFVDREALNGAWSDFLSSDKTIFPLLGEAGQGKTNQLCHWTETLSEAGEAVMIFAGADFADISLTDHLREVFGLSRRKPLTRLTDHLHKVAAESGHNVHIFFDAINECIAYPGLENAEDGPLMLFREICSIFAKPEYSHFKLLFTCRNFTWHQTLVPQLKLIDSSMFYGRGMEDELSVRGFSDSEVQKAYGIYGELYQMETRFEELRRNCVIRLKDPLLLKIACTNYLGKKLPTDNAEYCSIAMWDRMMDDISRSYAGRRQKEIIMQVGDWMLRSYQDGVACDSVYASRLKTAYTAADDPLHDIAALMFKRDGISIAFAELLNKPERPIMRMVDNEKIQFIYERFLEYVMARAYYERESGQGRITASRIMETMSKAALNEVFMETLSTVLLMDYLHSGNADTIIELLNEHGDNFLVMSLVSDVMNLMVQENYEKQLFDIERILLSVPDQETASKVKEYNAVCAKISANKADSEVIAAHQRLSASLRPHIRRRQLASATLMNGIFLSDFHNESLYSEDPFSLFSLIMDESINEVRDNSCMLVYYLYGKTHTSSHTPLCRNVTEQIVDWMIDTAISSSLVKTVAVGRLRSRAVTLLEAAVRMEVLMMIDTLLAGGDNARILEYLADIRRIFSHFTLKYRLLKVLMPFFDWIMRRQFTFQSAYVNNVIEYQSFWDTDVTAPEREEGRWSRSDFKDMAQFITQYSKYYSPDAPCSPSDAPDFRPYLDRILLAYKTGDSLSYFVLERILVIMAVCDWESVKPVMEHLRYDGYDKTEWFDYTQMSVIYTLYQMGMKMEELPDFVWNMLEEWCLDWTRRCRGYFKGRNSAVANSIGLYKRNVMTWYAMVYAHRNGDAADPSGRSVPAFRQLIDEALRNRDRELLIHLINNISELISDSGYVNTALDLLKTVMEGIPDKAVLASFAIREEERYPETSEDIIALIGKVLTTAKNYFPREVNQFLKKDAQALTFPGLAHYKDEILSFNPGGERLSDLFTHKFGNFVIWALIHEKVIDEVASEILEAAASAKDCVKWFDKSVRIVFRWTFDVNL